MGEWWGYLPETHRLPFVHLTDNPKFNTAGLFWGEALAGSIAFTFMNQGFIMRYLAIKSVNDGRKAALFNVLVTLPLSAVIVGAVGWIAKSLIVKQAVDGRGAGGHRTRSTSRTPSTPSSSCAGKPCTRTPGCSGS